MPTAAPATNAHVAAIFLIGVLVEVVPLLVVAGFDGVAGGAGAGERPVLIGAGIAFGLVFGAAEVVAGGEYRPLARQDHHTHRVVGLGAQECRGELHEQAAILGVAILAAAQHDSRDGAVVVGFVAQILVVGGRGGIVGHG
jgi:hypothetical protein